MCGIFLWCEACAYTGRYTDAFYRKQRLDRVLDSLHFRSYSVGFYYYFLAWVFPYFQYLPPLTLGRIYTPFIYGSTYDLQRSKTYFFFYRRIQKPTISSYIKLDFVSSLSVSSCVEGQLSAVVDWTIWPFWTSPGQVTRGWSKLEGKARWPSRRAPEELDSSELGPIQLKGCPGAIFQR